MLAETAISTAPTKTVAYSYLWFGDLPVASIEAATNTTRWYATDHLGTPLLQTSSSGGVVWRAEHTPYGDVFAFRAGATGHQPLRLPGQIAQEGSESYYNVFRWYRSGWGRYTQADPIGLDGGRNLFMYVSGNPIRRNDPLGLVEWACNITVSGVGEVGGIAAMKATCNSNCVKQCRRHVILTGVIYGVTFGLPVILTATQIRLEDGTSMPAGANLAGRAEYHALGANLIVGCSAETEITLGRAKGKTGGGCSWWAGLLSAGIDNFWGDAEISHQRTESCK